MPIKKSSVLLSLPCLVLLMVPDALAQEGTDWLSKERFQLRGRVVGVLPDGDGHVSGTALKTDVGDAVTPEVDLTYFLTNAIGLEIIAATAQHEIYANASNLGNTWILPPTVTLQYHFMRDQKFSPYIGAGLNYSWFYGEDDGARFDDLDVSGGFGYALQAGFDYWINDHWGLNFDAKYIDLDVDVDVNSGGTALSADDVELNPFIIGAGVSYRF
ncbi:OmpW/AlkL family protein [Micavibrio aeruginosavorus]|uniref:Outer membrane protein W n=1 Tax=Micavibrio aeruginosavorus EPB TaxID=349215 RepID=M4VH68_9BACT|nr:OmpW family outer membrane protein [Micavibrio aeruginosavorus]AGH98732.1 Outer membrane protein W precursor [Micavibrio aeruginosavorus EPB]